MLLNLIRHGETTWNELGKVQGQADPPLNQSGIEQAEEFAKEIKNEISSYKKVYCSALQRAVKTAQIIIGFREQDMIEGKVDHFLEVDDRLNSRNLGTFSGMTLAEIKANYPDQYTQWITGDVKFTPPEGESTKHMIERTKDFLRSLKGKFNDADKVMIVSHRENLGVIMYLITGKKQGNVLEGIKNCNSFIIEYK